MTSRNIKTTTMN